MDLDEFMEQLVDYGNELTLFGEGIEVVLKDGREVTGLKFDGNTSLVLEVDSDEVD